MRLDLAITSIGATTPVGETAVQSAAALRAGLAKPERLRDFQVDVPFDDSGMTEADLEAHAVAHRIAPLTDGFTQTGLWLRMAVSAVRDLIADGKLPPPVDAFWTRTALRVVAPDVTSDRFLWPDDEASNILERSFLAHLVDLAPLPAQVDRNRVTWGHAGVAQGAAETAVFLEKGAFDRVLVLGVDSYVDVPTMQVLIEGGRLKSPDVQTGLQPGEAAAAFILERPAVAKARGAVASATILAARYESPPTPPPESADESTPDASRGDRAAYFVQSGILWAKVIAEALADAGIARFAGDIIVDLNGEEWRASAWGMAQVRLQNVIDFAACKLVVPCASFGEIGAASGVAGVCLAARSFARDYATGDATLVVSLSENGEVGAIVVGRPPPS